MAQFETFGMAPLDADTAAKWRKKLKERGDVFEAQRLGISRLALVRAAAGLPVRRMVRDAVRETLGDAG